MHMVLAIAVTVTQVFGPWLCCCAPEILHAAISTKRAPEPQPTEAPAKKQKCQHCVPETPAPAPVEEKKPEPKPLPERCPCGGVELQPALPSSADVDLDLAGLITDAHFYVSFVHPPILPSQVPSGLRQTPLLPASEKLFVHHVLRC